MGQLKVDRVAVVGTHKPRKCGIATFTADLTSSIANARSSVQVDVFALEDSRRHCYAAPVVATVPADNRKAYIELAERVDRGRYDCVCVQHEFGIYGGQAGEYLLDFLDRVRVPVVTTLHTILQAPDEAQSRVMDALLLQSARVVTMSQKGRSILMKTFRAPAGRIALIPHGIRAVDPERGAEIRKELKLERRKLILTFGLLSPGKGIHNMVTAMNFVARRHPDSIYVVLGATHPNELTNRGDEYRDSLLGLVSQFGLEDNVLFVDHFVSDEELAGWLAAADVYVTPYLKPEQITSGTLAYAVGGGNAVVSTPYWHAKELLDRGRGVLVPFNNVHALVLAVSELLSNPKKRKEIAQRAAEHCRHMFWTEVGKSYLATFEQVVRERVPAGRETVLPNRAVIRTLRDLSRVSTTGAANVAGRFDPGP